MSAVEVKFVGGELDGQCRVVRDLNPRYRVPYLRQSCRWWQTPSPIDQMPTPQETEYVLTCKDDRFFYVERELMRLSEKEGIDPRDAE